MYSVFAADVVLGKRIREVIYLNVVVDALLNEAEAMLPDAGIVNCSLAD